MALRVPGRVPLLSLEKQQQRPAVRRMPEVKKKAGKWEDDWKEENGDNDDDERWESLCDFLERCSFCKHRLDLNQDIYMYRDLCAYCSKECRELQIAKDQRAERGSVAIGSTAVRPDFSNCHSKYNNLNMKQMINQYLRGASHAAA